MNAMKAIADRLYQGWLKTYYNPMFGTMMVIGFVLGIIFGLLLFAR